MLASSEATAAREREFYRSARAVVCLRMCTFLFVAVAMSVSIALVYTRTRDYELELFRREYEGSARLLGNGLKKGVASKVQAAAAFSAHYTGRFGAQNPNRAGIFPNCTILDFEQQAIDLLGLAGGRAISFNPIIEQSSNRADFEAHAQLMAETQPTAFGGAKSVSVRTNGSRIVADGIYCVCSVDNGTRTRQDEPGRAAGRGTLEASKYPTTMVPVYQIAPIETNAKAVMFNLHVEAARVRALDDMLTYKVPALTAVLQLVQDQDPRPSSILFYPVFEHFPQQSAKTAAAKPEVKGSISIVFSWDAVLADTVPDHVRGMVVVLKTTANQSYSFKMDGGNVTFMCEPGTKNLTDCQGDKHDTAFDAFKQEVKTSILAADQELEVAENVVTFSFQLYPSSEMQAQFVTRKPLLYAVGIGAIFLGLTFTFLLYDFLVTNNQNRLTRMAVRSSLIVDSLFPSSVRARLFGKDEDHPMLVRCGFNTTSAPATSANALHGLSETGPAEAPAPARPPLLPQSATTTDRIRAFMAPLMAGRRAMDSSVATSSTGSAEGFKAGAGKSGEHDSSMFNPTGDILSSEPIADEYQATTVLFADLAGFTAWSASRPPEHVFMLLEALYSQFDNATMELGIFKVETIGDCYMAVCGVPDAREDHAVAMAKFALEMQAKMKLVRDRLARRLGSEVHDLLLRVGIHSGSVTAGVIRGQRARFQLFGDTVNTASRMESLSKPGHIQVSSSTAELLRAAGHAGWLREREDAVQAKGKGELRTFWLVGEGGGAPAFDRATALKSGVFESDVFDGAEDVDVEIAVHPI